MLTFCKRGELTFTAVGYDKWKKALENLKSMNHVKLTKKLVEVGAP